MSIYSVVSVLTGLFESIVVFMLFDTYLERRSFPKWVYWAGIVALTVMVNISNALFDSSIFNLLGMTVLFFFASMLYKRNIKTQIILAVFNFLLIAVIEVVVLFFMMTVKDVSAQEITNNEDLCLLGIVLSKAMLFVVAKLICMRGKKNLENVKGSYWVLFISIVSTVLLAVFLLFTLQDSVTVPYLHTGSILCSIGLLYCMFLVLYLYEHVAKQTEELHKKRMLEQQLNAQMKHMDEMMVAQKEIRSVRHDLKNHMIALKSCFETGKCDQGIAYIQNLENQITQQGSGGFDTGNMILDAILFSKKSSALDKKIRFESTIQIPEDLNLDPMDICVLLGNALDNAIEACEKVEDPYIRISLIYEKDSLLCRIINPAPAKVHASLRTTKADPVNHGIGLHNIQQTLEKYKHIFRAGRDHHEFVFSFVIFGI